MMDGNAQQTPQVLRISRADSGDCLQLFLQRRGDAAAPAMGHGVVAGVVSVSDTAGQVSDLTIVSEIFDQRDANEAADATVTGLVLASSPDGSLSIVRSNEAEAAGSRDMRRKQRGFLPQQQRNNPGRTLGLSTNGHRRALPASVAVPVSGDLLTRIGIAVASLGESTQAAPIGRVIVVVQSAPEMMA